MANALAWVNASSGITYILSQDFESPGTPAGWTGTAGATFHNTTSPLEGTGDLQEITGNATYTFASTVAECWTVCLVKFVSLPTVETKCYSLRTSGGADMCHITVDGSGIIRCYNNSNFLGLLTTHVVAGTLYYFKMHYKEGTGANSQSSYEFSTSGTWVGSGNFFLSTSTGTAATDAGKLLTNSPDTGIEYRFDHIRIAATDVGSSFSNWI